MNGFYLLSLTLYTFGVYASGTMLGFHLRSPGHGCAHHDADEAARRASWRLGAVLSVLCLLWFLTLLVVFVGQSVEGVRLYWLQFAHLMLAYLFPPLIMHNLHMDVGGTRGRLSSPIWRLYLPVYVLGPAFGVYCILGFSGAARPLFGLPFGALTGMGIGAFFAVAAIYCSAALQFTRAERESRTVRSSRIGSTALFAAVLVLTLAFFVSEFTGGPDIGSYFQLLMSSMPLAFFFVGTWTENRFGFYDLFVKRGAAFLVTLVALVAVYALTLPFLSRVPASVSPWIHAIALLPIVLAAPWLHRRLERLLDSWWLGRSYGAGEAVRLFLATIRRASTEDELLEMAEQALQRIFRAPARVVLEPRGTRRLEFDASVEVPILVDGHAEGAILLGARESQAPYFSEDRTVLDSLADLLGAMRDTIRHQQGRIEQERQARELSLQASRSELKALRAQINPHFLFNALNAIAGLIRRDPDLADATVERLSEVFRYTLRRADSEWVVLEDELDFVQAYLDIERARFGERLQATVRVDDDAAAARVPAMLVQTLVENAVKHGAARVIGPARIEVAARLADGALVVEVVDSGPGFGSRRPVNDGERRPGTGFGLDSVRRRLAGHFGGDAHLAIERDEEAGLTRVRLTLPPDGPDPAHGEGEDRDAGAGGALAS